MRKSDPGTEDPNLRMAAGILRALAHPLRMKILEFIDQNDKINVNKIYNSLGLEQSITSQHLRILRNAELVKPQRDGKFIFYSINYPRMTDSVAAINKFLERSEMSTETETEAE